MEIFSKNLRVIFTLGLLGSTIYFCFRNFQLHQQVKQLKIVQNSTSSKSDTVYSTKPYFPVVGYPTIQVPKIVTFYSNQKRSKSAASSSTGSGNGSGNGSGSATNDVGCDSLVQFLLDNSHLKVYSVHNTDSITLGSTSKDFELDLDFYRYNWVNNQLTRKPINFLERFKPYTYISYRYFHNVMDAGFGLSFKTKTLIYKVGVNTFYYPKYKKDFGLDLEFKLEYNF